MKKHEFQHLVTVCETVPVTMACIVVKNEKDKKEILDMIRESKCKIIDNEIRFSNGNVISIIESKKENIRGKRAETKPWIDDFEKADIDLSFLDDLISKENKNNDGITFMSSGRKSK